MKRILLLLAIGIVTLLTFSSQKSIEVTKEATSSGSLTVVKEEFSRVSRVIDGDTVEIEGGRRVRYIGVDTPEVAHETKPQECFAKEASEINSSIVSGSTVRLVPDISDTDDYGRLLRYVYVGDILVNEALVRQGAARATPIRPDTTFANRLYAAQQEARENNRGLWSGCLAQ